MRTRGRIFVILLVGFILLGCQFAYGMLPRGMAPTQDPFLVSTADWIIPVTGPTETAQPEAMLHPTTPTPPAQVTVTVFFTDSGRYDSGQPPFETTVSRRVPLVGPRPALVLREFFRGPTREEQARGLMAVTSGFTGVRSLEVTDGVARVYLTGPCASNGAAYTIAQPLIANLRQFPEIQYVKIYDAQGQTEDALGATNSIPECLEP